MLIFHPVHMLVYLFSLFLTGWVGAYLARKAGISALIGVLMGVFLHILGLAILAVLWLIQSANDTLPPKSA